MSFDDDMKNRFQNQTPIVSNLDGGAAAAASSAARRTVAMRGIAAIVFLAVIGVGALSLTSDQDTNSLDVAGVEDPNTTDDAIDEQADDETVTEETSDEGQEVTEAEEVEQAEPDEEVIVEEPTEASEQEPAEQVEEPVDNAVSVPTVGDDMVFRVTAVASNDTLNARAGAGIDKDVVFEFAPDATGVVRTEAAPALVGQSEWIEVYGPISGTRGWVNLSFLEPIDVPDDRPCTFDEVQGSTATSLSNGAGSADSQAAVSSAMQTFRFGSCIRTVIEFSDGFEGNPVAVLPNDITLTAGVFDGLSIIDFGPSIIAAEAADSRFAENGVSQSIFVQRLEGGSLAGLIYGPSSTIDAAFDNENGRIIIDVADTGSSTGGVQPLLDENGVVLTDIFLGPDGVTISGLARPFEATLGVEVLFEGNPIDVEWVEGAISSGTSSSNGVMTTDWSSAWGAFDFTIAVIPSVDPFELVVQMDPTGGAADEPVVVDLVLEELLN